jgi:Terminase large subunit, T4likevirus-type, N-terminal
MKPLNQTTIIEACREPKLFAPLFQSGWFKKTDDSWKPWFAFLKALFGLPMDEAELAIFKQCTNLESPPDGGVFEAALICGRRSGKSRTMALVASYLATMVDWSPYLAKGERGTVVVVATDKKQARSIFNGVREFLKVKLLSPLIPRETLESLELSNGITIEILPASYRTIRGYTVVAALLDELAFWRTDEGSSNPDREIVNAVRPAMATVPASRLILASSPYGKRGELWDTYQRYYGKPGDVLVWKAPTKVMNPTIRQSVVDAAYRKDPADASAEWGAEFRGDISGWADRALIEAAVDHGMTVRPPIPGVTYVAFTDPSGGARDSFTAGVAQAEGDTAVLDCVVEIRSPFNPDEAVAQISDVLKSYFVTTVTSDRYAARWPVAAFGRHGIKLVHSERERSQIYLDALPLFTTGRARLLDNERLVAQFAGLVRTTSPSGRDKVDHGKTGADDVCNSAAGAMILATSESKKISWSAAAGNASLDTKTGRRLFQHGDYISDGITLRRIKPEPPPPADLGMVWSEEKQAYVKPWIDPNSR